MKYSCRLYKNTGFNSSNIPDTPTLLNQCAYIDVPAIDIMQDRFLSSVRVKVTWENVKDTDYLKLTNTTTSESWFYSVEGMSMQATDVCELSIVPDYINSIGGVERVVILDGITERVHVTDDSYGAYDSDDTLLTPSEPLQLHTFNIVEKSENYTLIESTIDVIKTGAWGFGKKYYDTNTETGETVTCLVPSVEPLTETTEYEFNKIVSPSPKTCAFNLSNDYSHGGSKVSDAILHGIGAIRSLGLEGSIINQVNIPSGFVDVTETPYSTVAEMDGETGEIKQLWGYQAVTKITGKILDFEITSLPYVNTNAKNNRINYSSFTKYGIISNSGESCEYQPEDIIESDTTPTVRVVSDPRITGKPYFRFKTVKGLTSLRDFFRNCVSGMQWKQVPLIYQGASGSVLNTMRYENSKRVSTENYNYGLTKNTIGLAQDVVSGTAGTITNALTGNFGEAVTGAVNTGFNIANRTVDMTHQYKAQNIQRQNELAELEIANTVVVPTINFPFNADMIRDFFGNGCVVYRYYYTQNDVDRIDKLLTMYGYKFAKPLETSDFMNRENFNFVMCSNVTVTGNNKWINNGIREQLANGVRVWHKLPSPTYYTNNPVKEN